MPFIFKQNFILNSVQSSSIPAVVTACFRCGSSACPTGRTLIGLHQQQVALHKDMALTVFRCSHGKVGWLLLLLITADPTVGAHKVQRIISDRHLFQNMYVSSPLPEIAQVTEQKGIVFPSGGTKQLANAYVAARVIRDYLACDLPIEIAYYGAHELDAYHQTLFQVSLGGV